MLERDRARVSERRASMQGEERESMLERDRVRVSERRGRVRRGRACWNVTERM